MAEGSAVRAEIDVPGTRQPEMPAHALSGADEISLELSSRRTGLSFQRTRMSADRTLMSVIRTSLSLISFGFTIYQFFLHLAPDSRPAGSAGRFGMLLVLLGVLMLVLGIVYHLQFMVGLRTERHEMTAAGLIHGTSRFPASMTLITALTLLLLGISAVLSMLFQIGPLG
jgi:inner membrane protein YidH